MYNFQAVIIAKKIVVLIAYFCQNFFIIIMLEWSGNDYVQYSIITQLFVI